MNDCIFCKIAKGEFNTEFLYEDDFIVAFNDINPQAPVHFLVVPKKHYSSLNELDDLDIISKIFNAIKKVSEKLGIKDYRTVLNTGKKAGQEVFHIHFHVMAGRDFSWPAG